MDLSTQAIGRAGEYLAASLFERHGVITTHVDVMGVDLWVQTPTGRRVTVQVKTTAKAMPAAPDRIECRYRFTLRVRQNHTVADVFCFVALDRNLLRLVSSAEISSSDKQSFRETEFTDDAMEADIKRYLY